jgi:GR25 family glycosyltransferase involved in LPS biosynthesis
MNLIIAIETVVLEDDAVVKPAQLRAIHAAVWPKFAQTGWTPPG